MSLPRVAESSKTQPSPAESRNVKAGKAKAPLGVWGRYEYMYTAEQRRVALRPVRSRGVGRCVAN